MSYQQVPIKMSAKQRRSLGSAITNGSSVKLKFTYAQLIEDGDVPILLTQQQINKIRRAADDRKGITVTLSKKQVQSMKSGGFLPVVLGALVSSLAPTIFNRLFPDKRQEGDGIIVGDRRQDYEMDGGALIHGDNGGDMGYQVTGGETSYMPNSGRTWGGEVGGGILLPGTARGRGQRAVKKTRSYDGLMMTGEGFVLPNSEKFQMLE